MSREEIASKVGNEVGIDPALVLTLLGVLIPLILDCFEQEELTPAERAKWMVKNRPLRVRRLLKRETRNQGIPEGYRQVLADRIILLVSLSPSEELNSILTRS